MFDFIGLCVEAKYHCFEWERAYPKSIKRVMKYVAVIIIIGSTRWDLGKKEDYSVGQSGRGVGLGSKSVCLWGKWPWP